jgi:hypothetical protein
LPSIYFIVILIYDKFIMVFCKLAVSQEGLSSKGLRDNFEVYVFA